MAADVDVASPIQFHHCFIVTRSSKCRSRAISNIVLRATCRSSDLHAVRSVRTAHRGILPASGTRPHHADIKIYSAGSHQQSSVVVASAGVAGRETGSARYVRRPGGLQRRNDSRAVARQRIESSAGEQQSEGRSSTIQWPLRHGKALSDAGSPAPDAEAISARPCAGVRPSVGRSTRVSIAAVIGSGTAPSTTEASTAHRQQWATRLFFHSRHK